MSFVAYKTQDALDAIEAERQRRLASGQSVPASKYDVEVATNGYLVLFREHERDIRLLILAVRALSVITALLTGYVVSDLL